LYLAVASLYGNFDLEAVEGSEKGFDVYREFGFAFDKDSNFGMSVRITGMIE
jgi:hypothetical protein